MKMGRYRVQLDKIGLSNMWLRAIHRLNLTGLTVTDYEPYKWVEVVGTRPAIEDALSPLVVKHLRNEERRRERERHNRRRR